MDILAKKIEKDGKMIATQNLQLHTAWVIEEALKLIDDSSLDRVAKISGFSQNKIKDLIFFSAYFHDMGKATKEFQSTIRNGSKSYHSLYSASVLVGIEDFDFLEGERYINLLLVIALTHHTLLPYGVKDVEFNFLNEAEKFFNGYKRSYENYLKKSCGYHFEFEIEKDIRIELESMETDLQYIKSNHKLRMLYAYVSGILNLADWLASARFSNTVTPITFNTQPSKKEFMAYLSFDTLREFQDNLSINSNSLLVEIPTGEGKTEGSLLWAINNLYNQHSKIIYTLPTQTTSNKLYERVQNFFDKSECGLIHSSAKIFLEKEYERENGQVDDIFKSDFLLSKSFNKPVTVSTIDSLLKYFINIGRFNIATKNFLNSVVIIDEIHAYDFKLMGFLKRFFELCEEMGVRVCLMSASIPNQIKKLLGVENYPLITQKELFEKKANEIFKVDGFLEDNLDSMIGKFEANKNVLIIRNTVKNATQTYRELKKLGIKREDILLYHSTFKKQDRTKKEDLIFKKLKEDKPFILVATQIVEVSLDIDFDVMFTDNAPIDSLIQRFGRVNRKKSVERKGECYIYQVKNVLPYRDTILDLTFETIQDGYFELGEYVRWLNIVYDKLFESDITIKNEITRLFDEAYLKYDETLKKLDGIKKSADNYDLRDIEQSKNDYLLYDDFMNEEIDSRDYYEYTVALPYYLEKEYAHHLPSEIEERLFYSVLKLDYSFDEGVHIPKKEDSSGFLFS
jgi:CRISPR-associated endonuclease/helicase Cas3